MFGSVNASCPSKIFVVLPRNLAATLTLTSRSSITLSWHFFYMPCCMLVKQSKSISAIMTFKRSNKHSMLRRMLVSSLYKIVFAIRYIELVQIHSLRILCSNIIPSELWLIFIKISLALSAKQFIIILVVFLSKSFFERLFFNHMWLF